MTLRIPALTLDSPCRESWNAMRGDTVVRHCGRCDQSVYNLSAMTGHQVAALFENGDRPCVRFYRRPDGTILTRDCAADRKHWLADWRPHGVKSAALLTVLALAACSPAAPPILHPAHLPQATMGTPPAMPFEAPPQPPLMGKIAAPPGTK